MGVEAGAWARGGGDSVARAVAVRVATIVPEADPPSALARPKPTKEKQPPCQSTQSKPHTKHKAWKNKKRNASKDRVSFMVWWFYWAIASFGPAVIRLCFQRVRGLLCFFGRGGSGLRHGGCNAWARAARDSVPAPARPDVRLNPHCAEFSES